MIVFSHSRLDIGILISFFFSLNFSLIKFCASYAPYSPPSVCLVGWDVLRNFIILEPLAKSHLCAAMLEYIFYSSTLQQEAFSLPYPCFGFLANLAKPTVGPLRECTVVIICLQVSDLALLVGLHPHRQQPSTS